MAEHRLKGMTWSHPRGFDPMVATSRIWRANSFRRLVGSERRKSPSTSPACTIARSCRPASPIGILSRAAALTIAAAAGPLSGR